MEWSGTEALEELVGGGGMVPAQMPTWCFWSPEKRLAGAVLADALIEIRDHHHDPKHRRLVAEDLAWLRSNDAHKPYSFIRLCQLLNVEPGWVRDTVRRWMAATPATPEVVRPTVTSLDAAARRRAAVRAAKAVLRTTDQVRVRLQPDD